MCILHTLTKKSFTISPIRILKIRLTHMLHLDPRFMETIEGPDYHSPTKFNWLSMVVKLESRLIHSLEANSLFSSFQKPLRVKGRLKKLLLECTPFFRVLTSNNNTSSKRTRLVRKRDKTNRN